MLIYVLIILKSCVIISGCFNNEKDVEKPDALFEESKIVSENDALFLTPYIERGQIEEAQELAAVSPFLNGVESFAGYLTVNKNYSSNLFFWLFKSQLGNWEERPLVVWLHGGPGSSSLFGMFIEVGPYMFTDKMKLKRRKFSWNRKYNLVFIDSPVGTGFSFTKLESGYAQSENDVSRDLYAALTQLYTLFPALQRNKLIITGESYGGKDATALAHKVFKMNEISEFKFHLAGLMIASGFVDPINMLKHSDSLYQMGLIDKRNIQKLDMLEEEIRVDIKSGRFTSAAAGFSKLQKEIKALKGQKNIFDFVNDESQRNKPEITRFINEQETKNAIHVGTNEFLNGSESFSHLQNEFVQTVKPYLEEMLSAKKFPILFYNGQLDIILAYPLSLNFYTSLQWAYAKDYHIAKRCQFRVGDEVAGYYKTAGTFTEVLVRNAGHLVSVAQPKWTFNLLDRFISNSSSFECI